MENISMTKYINVNELIYGLFQNVEDAYQRGWNDALKVAVNYAPAADVQEIRHGKWIYKGNRGRFPACECSVCGNVENADWAVLGDNVNYCPNCGAKMDLEEDIPMEYFENGGI